MRDLTICTGCCRTETRWKTEYLSWEELVKRLKKLRRTKETIEQYDKMSKIAKGNVKDGPAFVGGLIRGGRRKKENIDSRSVITLDADFANDAFLFDVDLAIGECEYVIYSTHSHRPNAMKFRLILPLDRDVVPDEYAAISRRIAERIGMSYFDKTTFDVHRLMYFPSCSADATPVFVENEGEPVGADDILESYEDWTDVLSWPRHEDAAINLHSKKAQDPRDKRGIIGLFCRAFSIEDGIDRFLLEQYSKGSAPNRYTYNHGTSANGLEVYPSQQLVFSHQDSDPISDGRTYNLFDLVRVHKFGSLDENFDEDSKATRPSIKAMEKWASCLKEVKLLAVNEREEEYQEIGISEDENPEEDDDTWKEHLDLHEKTGAVLPTSNNLELLLSNGEFKNVLAYDAFRNTEVIYKDLPWRTKERVFAEYEPWLAEDDNRLRHWLGKKFNLKGTGVILDAFKEVTRANKFHPIKEYLESVDWDGVERLDTLFIDYLGAEDCLYVREATRKMFLAAVTRIYIPGSKFDEMLVLVGPQGVGKSTILFKMGGKWFSDNLRTFETKEAGEHLQSGWIFEIGELSAMKRSQIEEVKAFLSKTEDRYRVAYDRVVTDFPRKCVFFGTTNTLQFLQDKTGNRRFWPILARPEFVTKSIWEDLTEEEIQQVWAEAVSRFKAGESLVLSSEAGEEANRHRGDYMEDNDKFGIIQEWLENPIEDSEYLEGGEEKIYRNRVCAVQVLVECFGIRRGDIKNWESKEVIEVLRNMPGWTERKTRARVPGYGAQRVFERV